MQEHYDVLRASVEAELEKCFTNLPAQGLGDAMRYSLLAGGKRIRPVLTMAFCEACGEKAKDALKFGCGVEMLHTYSLIHDDLPCMDNDDLRRGKPTNHKVFGECTAVLAGDALQAAAFSEVLSSHLSAEKCAGAAKCLADAAGELGMCAGQYLDMEAETKLPDENGLYLIERYKTAALIKAACKMGVIAAGGNKKMLKAAENYAETVGLAFQICDDILDIESSQDALGKTVGSDAARGKPTFASLMGIPAAKEAVGRYTADAINAARELDHPDFLIWLAKMLAVRDK